MYTVFYGEFAEVVLETDSLEEAEAKVAKLGDDAWICTDVEW